MSRPDLIGLLEGDLIGYRLDRRSGRSASFVPESGHGPAIDVIERVERRFLGRTLVARFGTTFPAPDWGDETLLIRQAGSFRRSGISVRSDLDGSPLAGVLESDATFLAAASALDFKYYEMEIRDWTCRVTAELLGASLVAIALPPIRSYVRLYPDQRQALVGSFEALRALVSVSPADRRY